VKPQPPAEAKKQHLLGPSQQSFAATAASFDDATAPTARAVGLASAAATAAEYGEYHTYWNCVDTTGLVPLERSLVSYLANSQSNWRPPGLVPMGPSLNGYVVARNRTTKSGYAW
jgi:hypothetical protein